MTFKFRFRPVFYIFTCKCCDNRIVTPCTLLANNTA